MPSCFVCKTIHPDLASIWVHFEVIHSLHSQSEFHCGEIHCYRIFSGIKSYRRHWQLNHTQVVEQPHSDSQLSGTPPIENQFTCHELSNNIISSSQVVVALENTGVCSPAIEQGRADSNSVDFSCSLRQDILRMIAQLYSYSTLPRNQVQNIIHIIQSFLGGSWLGVLRTKLENKFTRYGELAIDDIDEIRSMIDNLGNAFSGLQTEYQRFKEFEAKGVPIPPVDFVIGQRFERVKATTDGHVRMTSHTVKAKFFPLRLILKRFFGMPNVYHRVATYKQNLESETDVISNFIQGSLWKSKIVGDEGKQIFPLFVFFDDYETGNPLGSHAGNNKLGGVYVSIPCFPPEYQSALTSIYIALLFFTNDRREFGNERVFQKLTEELNFLQSEGIELELPTGKIVVYFKLGLFLGDNLGLHSILGFVESFQANFACRFCKMTKQDRARCCTENKALLRTPQSYSDDLLLNNYSLSGIKEECIFHRIKGFHVTDNRVVDVMHDCFEGVCEFDMVEIMRYFIERVHLFTLNDLNSRITCFDYGPIEEGNKPPEISSDHFKRNHISMSASEMLTFVRYFGLMVGDLVPEDDPVWNFYLILRDIISLITAKSIQIECCNLLKTLIEEHNRLYQNLFKKPLKPKAHHLVHYPGIMKDCGPLIHSWSMRFESMHRRSKLTAFVTSSRKNISTSLAIKQQLMLASQFILNIGFTEKLEMGPGDYAKLSDLNLIITGETPVSLTNTSYISDWVQKFGTKYKRGMVISTGDDDGLPTFGLIKYVITDENEDLYFVYKELHVLAFRSHFCAYETVLTDSWRIIKYEDLLDPMPMSMVNEHGSHYIVLRSWL